MYEIHTRLVQGRVRTRTAILRADNRGEGGIMALTALAARVAFYEPADVLRFAAWIDGERRNASRFEPREPGLLRDLFEGLLLWLAFQL